MKGIGGRLLAFNAAQFKQDIERLGEYTCEGHLRCVSDLCSVMLARTSAVLDSICLQFPTGATPNNEVTVIAAHTMDFDPMQHRGALQAVSPEEDRRVLLKTVAQYLGDATAMNLWAAHLRAAPLQLEIIIASNPEKHLRDVTLREQARSGFNVVARTTYGRMFEVRNFKVEMERDSGRVANAKLAEVSPPPPCGIY